MHKLTEDEFRQFLKRTLSDEAPEHFKGSERMIGTVLHEENLTEQLANFMMGALINLGPYGAAISLWATGFQMGREFESGRVEIAELNRLITPDEPEKPQQKKKRRIPRKSRRPRDLRPSGGF